MIQTGKPQYRELELTRGAVDAEARTVTLSVSSETPVERYYGLEILDHSPGSIRMDRISANAPLLMDHNQRDQIGVVESFQVKDRRTEAVVRFGTSQRAEEIFKDIQDGIRSNVSVGYYVHAWTVEKTDDKTPDTYRATDWEPAEVSIVSMPADITVGIGRSFREYTNNESEFNDVIARATEQNWNAERFKRVISERVAEKNNDRSAAILDLGEKAGMISEAREFIASNKGVDEFRAHILETKFNAKPAGVVSPHEEARAFNSIGQNERHIKRRNNMDEYTSKIADFSITRAINASLNNDFAKAGLEREIMEEAARRSNKRFRSNTIVIPLEVFANRALSVGTATAGGNLVATDLLAGQFINPFRNACLIGRLGATILPGLQGNVAIPRQSGAATVNWVAESGAGTLSDQTFDQVSLSPKTVIGLTRFSRRLAEQATPEIEQIVKNDLLATVAVAIDSAAINGTGSNNQPRGILNQSGIGAVVGGTNGLAPTWQHMVDLTAAVANANADQGNSLAFLTNTKVRAKLMATTKGTYLPFIWEDGDEPGFGKVAGFKAGVSNQVPSNLTKGTSNGVCSAIIHGNFAELVVAQWGAIEAEIDPYTYFSCGDLQARVIADVDIAVKHAASFAAMQDALTT